MASDTLSTSQSDLSCHFLRGGRTIELPPHAGGPRRSPGAVAVAGQLVTVEGRLTARNEGGGWGRYRGSKGASYRPEDLWVVASCMTRLSLRGASGLIVSLVKCRFTFMEGGLKVNRQVFLMVAAVGAVSGCASTDLTHHTDPAYADETFDGVVVEATGFAHDRAASMERALCDAFEEKNIRCARSAELFPPTREYDREEMRELLLSEEFSALLLVALEGSASDSSVVGYHTQGSAATTGSATTYGGTTQYQGSASGYSTTTPIRSFSRAEALSLDLYEADGLEVAWTGNATISASGAANVGDDAFERSFVRETVDSLKEAGHIKDPSE